MSEMVERVARRMAAYARTLPGESHDAPFVYAHRIGLARAAIEALLDPTDEVVQAGRKGMERNEFRDGWAYAINAALKK